VSHAHYDHLDLPSLRLLPPGVPVIVPRGVGSVAARAAAREVVELAEGEEVRVGSLIIQATRAVQDGGRGRRSDSLETIGFRIGGELAVYFAGDTDVFAEMTALRPLDVALLPVSGWGPRVPEGHLDPVRAARALELLQPRVCIPIHWGTFRPFYRREPYPADADAGNELVRQAASVAPDVEVRVLRPGERTEL